MWDLHNRKLKISSESITSSNQELRYSFLSSLTHDIICSSCVQPILQTLWNQIKLLTRGFLLFLWKKNLVWSALQYMGYFIMEHAPVWNITIHSCQYLLSIVCYLCPHHNNGQGIIWYPCPSVCTSVCILAQPVFDRLRCILCCFIYFQVLCFWLLLYIIYQPKSNKYRAIKFWVSSWKSDKAFHLERGQW